VAIGNPFGIGQTVTSGIVSALGRSGLGIEGYEDFIQTDASINPGNSGGALVNLRGELVGINTAILGPSQGNVGIGFAIPAAMVQAVVQQILRTGEVRRGRVGLSTTDVTPDIARAAHLAVSTGALVERVAPDSPADRAGLRAGDVVTVLNGRSIRSSSDLRNRIGLTPAGEDIELEINRAGRILAVRMRVAEAGVPIAVGGRVVPELVGARVMNAEPGMGLAGAAEGALVSGVDRGSAAYSRGLRAGDVIVGVNRRRVRTVQDLAVVLKNAERPWRLVVARGESRLSLVLP
jgi:serine protease Do/serine protease DegQ